MAEKKLADMTLDELTDYKSDLKKQIDDLHEEARSASKVQAGLIEEGHIAEAKRSLGEWATKNGKTLEEAADYWEGRLTFGDGVTPDTGRWVQALLVKGKPGKVRI